MAIFPKLKTGAVAQYPLESAVLRSTEVHRFMDSSDQRYRDIRVGRRRWVVRLTMLDDAELSAIRLFFQQQQGRVIPFEFEDPISGLTIPSCRFSSDQLALSLTGEHMGSAEIAIEEAP